MQNEDFEISNISEDICQPSTSQSSHQVLNN